MEGYNYYVPPEGEVDSKIAFVGEAPAYNELVEGRPFVGKSGQQFNNFLTTARIRRSEVYITNVFKVQVQKKIKPDRYYFQDAMLYHAKDGFTDAGMVHVRELYKELKEGGFNVVVPMGNPALKALIGVTGITKYRGSILWSDEIGKKVIPAIHPAATLRVYTYKYLILKDFRRAMEESLSPDLNYTEREYIIAPSFNEIMDYLSAIKTSEKVDFDIEVINQEVSCISFCDNPRFAISIPFVQGGQPYFPLDQEQDIWHEIATILENPEQRHGGQNLAFDIPFLFRQYGILTTNPDDTMIAHRIMYPDLPAGLDFITSMYTREPYYKEDGKESGKNWSVVNHDFWIYNAKDSVICNEAMPQLEDDLKRIGNYDTYKVHTRLIEPVTYMGYRGLRVDVPALAKERDRAEEELNTIQEELNTLVGSELNANSPKQVATYFYIKKNIKPYKKDGATTTNDGALKRIARKGFKEASLILKLRHLRKMIGTYYDAKLRGDRLCCSYSPITGMGRLSSSSDIFGFGTNLQNQPQSMNQFFLADEGHLIYDFDLAQADNRAVAYMAPEPRMIKAFEEGEDVHALTASWIFYGDKEHVDEIKQMHKEDVKCDIGYGDQTHRYWGKKCNHALNYGMGYKLFSYALEIQESEGKALYNKYHSIYPGVTKSFHAWVRHQLGQDRILTNPFGRRYYFMDRWGDQLFNKAYAFPAQSNTADIINRRALIPIYYESPFEQVDLLRQVHDSVNFQIPISAGIDYHIQVIEELKSRVEEEIKWKQFTFSIPLEGNVGTTLNKKSMIALDLSKDLRIQLKELFIF